MSTDRKIFRGMLSAGGLTAVSILAAFVQFRFVLEFLSRDLAGIWFLFISIGSYIAFLDFGISPTVSREMNFIRGDERLTDEGRCRGIADLVKTSLRALRIIAILAFVVSFAVGALLFRQFGYWTSPIILAWGIFSFGAALNVMGGGWLATLYGMGDVATERLIRTLSILLATGLGIALLYAGLGLIGLAIAWALQGIGTRTAARIAIERRYPMIDIRASRATAVALRKIAYPSIKWSMTTLGALLILNTDNLIIGAVLGPSAIPSYDAASKVVMAILTLAMLIASSSTPFLSKAHAEGRTELFNALLLRDIRVAMSLTITAVAFLAIFGERLISLWLGPGNFIGYPVLWTLLAMLVLEIHHSILATAVMATGRIAFAGMALSAGALNIVISLVLVHYLGAWGVALGTLLAQLMTNNWYAPYVAFKHLNIDTRAYARVCFSIITMLALLLTTAGILAGLLHGLGDVAEVIVALAIVGGIGFLFTFAFMLTSEERSTLRSLAL